MCCAGLADFTDYVAYQSPYPKCSLRNVSDPCSIDVFCAANILGCTGLNRTVPAFNLAAWTAGFANAVVTANSESFLTTNNAIGVFALGVTVACGPLQYDFSLGVGDSCSSAQWLKSLRVSSTAVSPVLQLQSSLSNNASVFMNVSAWNLDGGTVFLTCAAARVDVTPPEAGQVRCSPSDTGAHQESFASITQIPVAIQGEFDLESLVHTVSLDVINATGGSLLLSPLVIQSLIDRAHTFTLQFASTAPQGTVVRIVKKVRNQAALETTVISATVILDSTPPIFDGSTAQRTHTRLTRLRLEPHSHSSCLRCG